MLNAYLFYLLPRNFIIHEVYIHIDIINNKHIVDRGLPENKEIKYIEHINIFVIITIKIII